MCLWRRVGGRGGGRADFVAPAPSVGTRVAPHGACAAFAARSTSLIPRSAPWATGIRAARRRRARWGASLRQQGLTAPQTNAAFTSPRPHAPAARPPAHAVCSEGGAAHGARRGAAWREGRRRPPNSLGETREFSRAHLDTPAARPLPRLQERCAPRGSLTAEEPCPALRRRVVGRMSRRATWPGVINT